MEKRELINLVDKALYLSTEADELYEKFKSEQKKSRIRGAIFWSVLIIVSLYFIAPSFILIGNATGNELLRFLGNAFYDYYIFVLAFILPIYFFTNRVKKFKRKMIKTEKLLIAKEERLAEITVIPDNYKNSYALEKILSYLEDGRSENMKESINLFVKEEQEERRYQEMMSKMDDISEQQSRDSRYLGNKLDDIETKVRNLD